MVRSFTLAKQDRNETPVQEIAQWRLYLLRAGYLLIAVGMGMQKVPAFLHHRPWELMHGVVNSMLLALVGGGVEGHVASRGGTACVAEPHYGCRTRCV